MQLSLHLGRTASLLLLLSADWAALALPVQPQDAGAFPSLARIGLPHKRGLDRRSLLQFHRRSEADAVMTLNRRATRPSAARILPRLGNQKSGNGVRKVPSAGPASKAASMPLRNAGRRSIKQSGKRAKGFRAGAITGKGSKVGKPLRSKPADGRTKIYPPQAQRLLSTLSRSSSSNAGGGGGNRPQRPTLAPLVIPAPSSNGPSSTAVEVGSPRPPLTSPDNSLPPSLPPASPNSPAPPPGPPPSPAVANSGDSLSQGAFGSSMPTVVGQMDWGRPGHPGGKKKE